MRLRGFVLVVALAAGCGGGGGSNAQQVLNAVSQALQNCVEDRTLDLFDVLQGMADLFGALNSPGNPPASVTEFLIIAEQPITYDFEIDLGGIAVLSGTVFLTSQRDDQAQVDVDWGLSALDGSLTGTGDLSFVNVNGNVYDMTGTATVADLVADCSLDLDVTTPLRVTLPRVGSDRRVAANVDGINLVGDVAIDANAGTDDATATMSFAADSNTVQVSDVTVNGAPGLDFSFQLPGEPPPPAEPGPLLECTVNHLATMAALLQALPETLTGDELVPSTNRDDPPNTFTFSLTVRERRVFGRVTFSERGDAAFVRYEYEGGSGQLEFGFDVRGGATVSGNLSAQDGCTVLVDLGDIPTTITGTDLVGSAFVEAAQGDTSLRAGLVLREGSSASLVDGTFNGEPLDDVPLSLG